MALEVHLKLSSCAVDRFAHTLRVLELAGAVASLAVASEHVVGGAVGVSRQVNANTELEVLAVGTGGVEGACSVDQIVVINASSAGTSWVSLDAGTGLEGRRQLRGSGSRHSAAVADAAHETAEDISEGGVEGTGEGEGAILESDVLQVVVGGNEGVEALSKGRRGVGEDVIGCVVGSGGVDDGRALVGEGVELQGSAPSAVESHVAPGGVGRPVGELGDWAEPDGVGSVAVAVEVLDHLVPVDVHVPEDGGDYS